jgi:protein-L-isoaspartate(D-aspartate) O-methyltransferase
MVAIMNEALDLRKGMRVLEVGAGSGYHSATIAEIVGKTGHVYTIEYLDKLAEIAKNNLSRAGYADRVSIVRGDGSLGYPDHAPYERILVTAAAPKVPEPLLEQLAPSGILILPIGGRWFPQELVRVSKKTDGTVERSSLGGVTFVPLVGKHGFNR